MPRPLESFLTGPYRSIGEASLIGLPLAAGRQPGPNVVTWVMTRLAENKGKKTSPSINP
jgi:hypothetical protein